MGRTIVTRTIKAPAALVFDIVAHVENFSKAVPNIKSVEFLSERHAGVGTRFKETRVFNGRESSTELEVTEYVENDHVRLVADAGGTIWDTVFTVRANGEQTTLEMVMDANAYQLKAKLTNPLVKGMVQKAIENDMDAVKAYCENQ